MKRFLSIITFVDNKTHALAYSKHKIYLFWQAGSLLLLNIINFPNYFYAASPKRQRTLYKLLTGIIIIQATTTHLNPSEPPRTNTCHNDPPGPTKTQQTCSWNRCASTPVLYHNWPYGSLYFYFWIFYRFSVFYLLIPFFISIKFYENYDLYIIII